MKQRTKAFFKKAIQQAQPGEPIRFDCHAAEVPVIRRIYADLIKTASWGIYAGIHADAELADQDVMRVCLFGPQCSRPKTEDERFAQCYSPAEILRLFRKNAAAVEIYEHAFKNPPWVRNASLQANAKVGGHAVAHYTDAAVEGAFRAFKERHASATAWEAANALIRAGQALCKWRHVNSAWNRIGRMAADLGLSRTEWFDEL